MYCLTLGDRSQEPWMTAPDWQRDSAVKGVEFHLSNPDAGPAASHVSWLKVKADHGWKYGAVKDVAKKEHPCFVPYEELSTEQQAKDHLFSGIVHSLARFVDR